MDFIQQVSTVGKSASFDKKQCLFHQGDKNTNVYFITRGAVKAVYLTDDGKEQIKSFLFNGDVIASVSALNGGHCSFSVECLAPTSVMTLSYRHLREQATKDIELANSVIELLMAFAKKKEQREFELLCWSAPQRYLALLERVPDIADRVTQNDMAKYLGITPVALSRIKHQLLNTG